MGPTKKQKLRSACLRVVTAIGISSMLMLHSCSGSSPHQLKPPVAAVAASNSASMDRKYLYTKKPTVVSRQAMTITARRTFSLLLRSRRLAITSAAQNPAQSAQKMPLNG